MNWTTRFLKEKIESLFFSLAILSWRRRHIIGIVDTRTKRQNHLYTDKSIYERDNQIPAISDMCGLGFHLIGQIKPVSNLPDEIRYGNPLFLFIIIWSSFWIVKLYNGAVSCQTTMSENLKTQDQKPVQETTDLQQAFHTFLNSFDFQSMSDEDRRQSSLIISKELEEQQLLDRPKIQPPIQVQFPPMDSQENSSCTPHRSTLCIHFSIAPFISSRIEANGRSDFISTQDEEKWLRPHASLYKQRLPPSLRAINLKWQAL